MSEDALRELEILYELHAALVERLPARDSSRLTLRAVADVIVERERILADDVADTASESWRGL